MIDAIELDGMKVSEVIDYFHLSPHTINLWQQLKAETEDFLLKAREHRDHSHKISGWEKCLVFAQEHQSKTQAQMAQLWEGTISERRISRALQKIEFTQEKELWLP